MEPESLAHEGDIAFTETETPSTPPVENEPTETPSESSAEVKQADVEPEAKPLPFNEDPKIQDYIQRQVEQRIKGEMEPFKEIADRFAPKEEVKVPTYWNGDEASYQNFVADQRRIAEEVAESRVKALEQKSQAETDRIREANEWFESNVRELEADGQTVDRNLLLKTTIDNGLVDTQGRWHFKAAAKLMKADEKPVDKTDRKKLADMTTSDNKGEPVTRDYATPKDLKGVW